MRGKTHKSPKTLTTGYSSITRAVCENFEDRAEHQIAEAKRAGRGYIEYKELLLVLFWGKFVPWESAKPPAGIGKSARARPK